MSFMDLAVVSDTLLPNEESKVAADTLNLPESDNLLQSRPDAARDSFSNMASKNEVARRKSTMTKSKALTRANFTTGLKMGDGAYGTVFKVQFLDEAVEMRATG